LASHHGGLKQAGEEIKAKRVFVEARPVAVFWWLIGLPFNGMVAKDIGANSRGNVAANRGSYGWAGGFLIDG
jgi:hypothetical protein